jgi:adenine-specific DNA-methyltransferase
MYIMNSTENMPYIDLKCRQLFTIKSRIVWSYDSSGVQAKNYFGSMYEPILMMVKDQKNYTFNRDDILVEAKTGAQRALIDYRKIHRSHTIRKKCREMSGSSHAFAI